MRSQNEEERIILSHFKGKRNGYVVDVGAYDGLTWSNSATLLIDYDWSGLLIEPVPEHAEACRKNHAGRPVVVFGAAVDRAFGRADIYPCEMVSTMSTEFRDWQEANVAHVKYGEPITVNTFPLDFMLRTAKSPSKIDFLTIDCEGRDLQVLQSMDWFPDVDLICVELKPEAKDQIVNYLRTRGYSLFDQTKDNGFFRR